MTRVGQHLLGRLPSPPDDRDWRLARFLAAPPVLPPTRAWRNRREILNQGDSPHCVAGAWCQWGNTYPVADRFTDADLHAVYYECKLIDGEPGAETGSFVRSGATAMLTRGRLEGYAFAASLEEVAAWLSAHGPVVVGTDWTTAMFKPDDRGFVRPAERVEGGHAYLARAYRPRDGTLDDAVFGFLNSWGKGWGLRGRFYMRGGDFRGLLAAGGEAVAAVELPK